ncbi:MAG: cardiolipin synthase [Syntrophales bacterium]|jgi:cardiolipin synthase|nr:cardiolipin synthase [Syntrophales bacterium]MDY0043499.1 cardiolipin synthase [Syntrophales bacterium]
MPFDEMRNVIDYFITFSAFVITALSAGHALLSKRDPKAALGWIALCFIVPFIGPFIYFLFGINRVRTRAKKLKGYLQEADMDHRGRKIIRTPLNSEFVPYGRELVNISDVVAVRPLLSGNTVDILHNGEEAFPAMLRAIENARKSVYLSTYIFETNETGRRFINALGNASLRGVDVKVIIDGIGELYSFPRAGTLLKKQGVDIARFLPPKLFPPTFHINLRNHRKILLADEIGFTGGMNIGDRHLANRTENQNRVVDIHFRLSGPVVEQIGKVFWEDWQFVTGRYEKQIPYSSRAEGSAACRVITEGPNEDLDKLSMILIGGVSSAKSKIIIMTPYFIPPRGLLAALQAAALKGVEVIVVLPEKNNLSLVHWATRNLLWELLERGVKIYYQPAPFVHTKLFMIDDTYINIGSANIDPRSLRLNFELAVEVYDTLLSRELNTHIEKVLERSRLLTLEEVDGRSLPVKVRDALAWLLSPYL